MRLVQLTFIGVIAFLVGLALSFYTATQDIGFNKPSREVIKTLSLKTRNAVLKVNHIRKKYFLLPHEVIQLKSQLSLKQQELAKERSFKEELIRQTLDEHPYIVISLSDNTLYLKQKDKILRKAKVATGRDKLQTLRGQTYHFFTPRTIFTIERKIKDPIWVMPNWAFHEKSQPVPLDPQERKVHGVLGKYAFYLGNGYMIHGTINPSDLGKYITHGCIRVGKRDLKALYEFVPVGTKVYIY